MKAVKKIVQFLFFIITIEANNTELIYLSSNGVHLDIILEKKDITPLLLEGLVHLPSDNLFSFGWGDEAFYLNTPTWADLTLKNALNAVFIKGPSSIHLTRFKNVQSDWIKIKLSKSELSKINELILQSFITDNKGNIIFMEEKGYSNNDDFYKAKDSYSFYKTCNSWVNTIFKKSGLKACLWTPFDFGLMNKYR